MRSQGPALEDWQASQRYIAPAAGTLPSCTAVEAALYRACAQQTGIQIASTCPPITLVPLTIATDDAAVAELITDTPLSDEALRTLRAVQRFIMHLHALLDENERDSLTRLLNRKSFDETFSRTAQELADPVERTMTDEFVERRAADGPFGYWLGVVDIDHFKRVNDIHGHLIGDEVLILTARIMKECFRSGDRLYRFGGEEFVVLLRCHHADEAAAAFERLRLSVEQFPFPRIERLTISIGFTAITAADTPSTAFERADQAVYHAKGNGRNQVASHETLVQEGILEAKDASGEIEFF
jgi:diguanylate cyclase (GGDEF)-like protein